MGVKKENPQRGSCGFVLLVVGGVLFDFGLPIVGAEWDGGEVGFVDEVEVSWVGCPCVTDGLWVGDLGGVDGDGVVGVDSCSGWIELAIFASDEESCG